MILACVYLLILCNVTSSPSPFLPLGIKKRLVCEHAMPSVFCLSNTRFSDQQENMFYRLPALLKAAGVNSLAGKFALKL